MLLDDASGTNRLPLEYSVSPEATTAEKGEPATGVRVPFTESMLYDDIVPSRLFVAKRNPPTPVTENVPRPAGKGDPARGIREPSLAMVNAAIALALLKAT